MERFGPSGNFPVKVVHLQRWSSLTVRSGGPKLAVPWFQKILVYSPTLPNSNQNCGRNVNELLRLETLIQLSNVVPFTPHDDSTGFSMFGLATRKAPLKTDHHHVDLGGIVCKPQKCSHNLTGISCRKLISQIVQKFTFPEHSNMTLGLELFAPPTSLHFSAHLS